MIQFDEYFSNGLAQPPPRKYRFLADQISLASDKKGADPPWFSHGEMEVDWTSELTIRLGDLCIAWMRPPPSNSDHQDYYIFSRESL